MNKLLLLFIFSIFSILVSAQSNFITTWKTTTANESITIPTSGISLYNYDVSWENDGKWETGFNMNATHSYSTPGIHTVAIRGTFPSIDFTFSGSKQKIMSIEQWGSNVWTTMKNAFYGCTNLTINAVDAPNLSSVTDMSYMFNGCSAFNQDIGNWNVSNVTNMSRMFFDASSFNQDISNWNVSKVTNMYWMFFKAAAFNQPIGTWNVSKVTDMTSLFQEASAFNQDIGNWNVSSVTKMISMFNGCSAFNQDIGNWNVSNVTDMSTMFQGATTFNQDISSWNIGKVTNMVYMFASASAFNQNLGSWNVSNVTSMAYMFKDITLSTANYDALLNGWNNLTLKQGVTFSGGNSKFCNGETSRANMVSTFGWTITDGGKSPDQCTVPITLIAFKAIANKENNSVKLSWATLSEFNNDYFTIERSKDGKVFEEISKTTSAGNSNNRQDYAATDSHPFDGYSYYRLKQTDKDGKFTYSQIEKVYLSNQPFTATLAPNPTRNIVQLKIDGVIKKGMNYTLIDMVGKKLANGTITTNTTLIDLKNRAQGTYILQVIDDGRMVQSFKIIKTN